MPGKAGRRGNRQGSVRTVRGRWTVRYRDEHGALRERVTAASSKREALQELRTALDQVERQRGTGPMRTVADLKDYACRVHLTTGKRTTDLEKRWKALASDFATVEATAVTSTAIAEYIERRRVSVAKSTVNRELATLRHVLRLAAQATPPLIPWDAVPTIELADESDLIRTDFFEDAQWTTLKGELAEHLRPLFTVKYWLGWRRGELLSLERSQVDLERGTVRLKAGSTKNKEGRLVYLPPEALTVLKEQERRTRALERAEQRIIPWVFHNQGERIRDYYTGWRAACERAGCPGMVPHDFRRTAARNYTRAGVTEGVAMKITGHKTRAVFERYNITAERDLAEAATRVSISKKSARMGRAWDKAK